MNKELFISSTPHETKVAVVEDDLLVELHYERENEYTLAGSIYKGRVTRVLPGMQSAFVDVGLERDAFLYVTDFLEEQDEQEEIEPVSLPAPREPRAPERSFERAQPAPRGQGEEVQPHLIAPPPAPVPIVFEGGADDLDEEDEAGAAGEAPAAGDAGGEEGARRWRGRRRRGRSRRGGRGFPEAKFSHEGREPEPREVSEPRETREPREPQPRETREPRETRAPRETRETRAPRARQDYGPPPGYQPIILPGESISKYQHLQSAAPAQPRPRAERAPEPPAPPPEVVPEALAAAPPAADDDLNVTAAAAEVVAPAPEFQPGPGPEFFGDTRDPEETPHAPLADARADQRRFEQMNVAAVFGGGQAASEAEPEPDEIRHALAAEESAAPPPASVEIPPLEAGEHDAPGGAAFAPGAGHVEEEVIDEEEAELAAPPTEPDDIAFEELEEETLERAAGAATPAAPEDHAAEHHAAEHHADTGADAEFPAASAVEPHAEAGDAADQGEEGEEGEEEFDEADEAQELAERELEDAGRAEMRAPADTAGFQRTPRPQFDRRRLRSGRGRRGIRREPPRTQMISELLKEGQEILVQIAKEPIGKKGARITSHIALPGRFLVYMPTVNHIGVSRKISSEEERQRLKRIVTSEREDGHGGFIVRTAADRAPEEELRADIRFLKHLWHEIKQRSETSKPPALIYHDLSLVERILRDQVNENFTAIWVDTESDYERLIRFVNRFQPALVKRVKLYTKQTPLFEQFNIQEEINKALKSKVWLKSGGYIVINQTEALVAIDVNTGKYVGKTQRLEDTIVKTNVDAIREIVRQIRLRDLGGIIIIDFIDMDERRNRQKVMQALEEALKNDRAPSKTLQFNDFGLVALTRKRVKQSLERTLGTPCPYCTGTGFTKSATTLTNEIWVEMRKMARHFDHPDVMLRVHPEVAKALKANGGRWIQEMEELTGRNIIVKSDAMLHQEQFDIQ